METTIRLSTAMLVLLAGSRASDLEIRPESYRARYNRAAVASAPESPSAGTAIHQTVSAIVCVGQGEKVEQACTLLQAGHYTEARAKLVQALETPEQHSSADTLYRASVMGMLGFVALQQDRPDQAAEWYRRALDLKPLPDALYALLTNNLAHAYGNSAQLDRAEELARRAIPLLERAFGAGSPEVLFPHVILASVHAARGDYAVAEPVFRRVLHYSERSWGPSSYEVAQAAGNLAAIYLVQGRYALARELFEKSVAGLQLNPMRTNAEIPLMLAGLAQSCAASGKHREADVWLQQALASEQELDPDQPAVAVILERAAVTRFHRRDYETGWRFFERVIALLEARHGPGSAPVLAGLERYAALVRAAKDKTRARQLDARRKALIAKR